MTEAGGERSGDEAGEERARKPEGYWRRKRSPGQHRAMLTKAIAHPLRRRILRQIAGEGAPLGPIQIGKTLGAPLGTVVYHAAVLRICGAVKPAGERPACGAVERFYEATTDNDPSIEALLEETRELDEDG